MKRPLILAVAHVLLLAAAFIRPAQDYPTLSQWDTTHIDAQPSRSGLDGFHALALDSADRPHIAYFDAHTGSLAYATLAAGPGGDMWRYDVIDSGDVGRNVAIALDSADRPTVSYYDSAGDALKVATLVGGVWTTETVAEGGNHGSIAIGPDDQPRVSYSVESQLYYAQRSGGLWQIEPVGLPGSLWVTDTSLALDSSGAAHIAYCLDDNIAGHIRYARWAGANNWIIEPVADGDMVDSPRALALDSAGRPYLAYRLPVRISIKPYHIDFRLMLATRTNGVWASEELDYLANPPGWEFGYATMSAAVDSQDRPHVATAVIIDRQPRYYYREGDMWQLELIGDVSDTFTYSVAMALGQDDQPRLSFNRTDMLFFARRWLRVLDRQAFLPFTP